MDIQAWGKIIMILIYTCLISFVPEMPNYYTFLVNCLGLTLTLFGTILLIWFLTTRPPSQRNLLNRILTLFAMALLLGTFRTFLLSIPACFWNSEFKEFVENHPLVTAGFLSLRCFVLLSTTLVCALSAGRLLLFVKPVLFQKIDPVTGVSVIGSTAVIICMVDITYTLTFFSDMVSLDESMLMVVFKAEMGIEEKAVKPRLNTTLEEIMERNPYNFLPLIQLTVLGAVGLEITKVVYAFTKEYVKLKKATRVLPRASRFQPQQPTTTVRLQILRREQNMFRSESFPSMSQNLTERRTSLPQLGQRKKERKQVKICVDQASTNTSATNLDRKSMKKLKELVRALCLRTANFVYVFGLIGIVSLVVSSFTYSFSPWSVVVQITACRLVSYLLVVLLIFFDKDIYQFLREKISFLPL